jgi:hypothetical protein
VAGSTPAPGPLLKRPATARARGGTPVAAPRASTSQSPHSVILELQRIAGNAAVAGLLTGRDQAPPDLQWVTRTLSRSPEGTAPAPGSSARGMEAVLLEKVASGGDRPLDAAALVPAAAGAPPGGPVSVLLHLHGISVIKGHGYEQMIRKGEIPPEYEMAPQLQAYIAANPQSRIVALLPAGKTVALKDGKYDVDFGGFDTDKLADETIKRLTGMGRLPPGSTAGGVIVSAHSGGGFAAKKAAKGKKVVGMFAFESIHGDADQYRELLQGRLEEDLHELTDIASRPGASADQVFQAQKQYLAERGFRFVGFAGSNKGYRDRFRELDRAIHGPSGWVEKHAPALRQAGGAHYGEVRALLEANYQFHVDQAGDHFKVMQGNLAKALGAPLPAAPAVGPPVVHGEKPGQAKEPAPARSPAANKKPKRRHRTGSGPIAIPEGALRSSQLPAFGGAETTAFMKAVYDKEQQLYLAEDEERALNGEPTRFSRGVPDKQLGSVDGKPIHKLAEGDANNLLSKARSALDTAKAKKDARALGCHSIGVSNAYRSPDTDFDAWQDSFQTHYSNTKKERQAMRGGPFGEASVTLLAVQMKNYKATPGFSNHTQGMAMDFMTVQDGIKLSASSKQKALWLESWLYHWLVTNGHLYNFSQLPTEEWHWDHRAATAGPAAAQQVSPTTHPAPAPAVQAPNPVPLAPPAPAAAKAAGSVSISFGPNARQDAVAASSVEILADILRAAGLTKATITSTARSAADQARAMYQNLVTAGVEAQRALYRSPGNKVIDTFVALTEAGKSPAEIEEGMRDRIIEIGPSNVSRHCGDFQVLNVFDVGPYSLGGAKARKAFADAATAEVGKRISKFIPWPKDPGEHLEIKMSSAPPAARIPATPEPAAPAVARSGAVADWLSVLPRVKRDRKQRITTKDYGVVVPAVESGTLTAAQQQVVNQIHANREKLPSLISDKDVAKKGVKYHDAVTAQETATPTELQNASAPGTRARKLVWEEVRTEGGLDSINTYDSEIVTWGKGFSAKSHSMNEVLLTLFESDPEAKQMLFDAGIALTARDWMVVNGDTGGIETGDNALRLLQFDRKLLSVFITLGSDPKHSGHSLDAQWAWIRKRTANVPEYAYDWPADSIKLMAHLSQWMPALRWGLVDYKATGGDIYQVIKVYLRHFMKIVGGALAPTPGSGALLFSAQWDMALPGHRFYAFAGGAGIQAIKADATVVTAAQVDADAALAGHIVIPIPPPKASDKKRNGAYIPRSSHYFDLGP